MGLFDKISDTANSVQQPIYDNAGVLQGYVAGDKVVDVAGKVVGDTATLNAAIAANAIATSDIAKEKAIATRTVAPVVETYNANNNNFVTPAVQKALVNNKGVIGKGDVEEDTLLPLTIETSRLMATLTNTVWPVVPVHPAYAASFDDAGLTLTPRVGKNGVQVLGNVLTCPVLGYKISSTVRDTLNGNGRTIIYGADPANYITFLMRETINTIYALPRNNGIVRNYTPTGGVDGTFGTLLTADFTNNVVDTTNDLVNDDYAPEGAFTVGGVNCDVRITPFVPTPAEVLELRDVIAQQDQKAVIDWIFGKLMKL